MYQLQVFDLASHRQHLHPCDGYYKSLGQLMAAAESAIRDREVLFVKIIKP